MVGTIQDPEDYKPHKDRAMEQEDPAIREAVESYAKAGEQKAAEGVQEAPESTLEPIEAPPTSEPSGADTGDSEPSDEVSPGA